MEDTDPPPLRASRRSTSFSSRRRFIWSFIPATELSPFSGFFFCQRHQKQPTMPGLSAGPSTPSRSLSVPHDAYYMLDYTFPPVWRWE